VGKSRREQRSKRGRRGRYLQDHASDGGAHATRGLCPATGKRQWISRAGAVKAARDMRAVSSERRARPYFCGECHHWHLAHTESY